MIETIEQFEARCENYLTSTKPIKKRKQFVDKCYTCQMHHPSFAGMRRKFMHYMHCDINDVPCVKMHTKVKEGICPKYTPI